MAKPASGTSLDTGHALYSVMRHIWALLEGSGTTSVDSKGSNNLTLSGSGLWATNGGGENIIRIVTAENAPLTIGTPFTLGAGDDWSIFLIAKEAADDNAGMIIGDRITAADSLWLNTANGFTFRYGASNNNIALSGASRTTTATYAFTYDFISSGVTTVRVYRNGSLLGNFDNIGFQPTFNTLGNGYTSTTFALQGDIECCYVFDAALSSTDVSNLHAAPYGIFAGSASISAVKDNAGTTITALPSNHGAGTLVVKLVGTGTSWDGSTNFSVSGVSGWSVSSKANVDGTHETLTLGCPAAASPPAGTTGTLTITDTTNSISTTIAVNTPTLGISPTSGATGTTPSLTLTGTNTLWANETAAGLFSESGGTGASIATPTVSNNTSASAVLTVGSAAGSLTITDTSTGAAATFTATAGTIAAMSPVANQWKRGGGSSITLSVGGTSTGSPGSSIKYRLDNGGGYGSYATVDAAPSGGNWSGSIVLPASETDYTAEFSFQSDPSVTTTVAGLANIRTVIAKGGQSNEAGRGNTAQTIFSVFGSGTHRKKTASGYAVLADPTGTDGPAAGSYAIHELNILGAALGRRLGLCNFAVGGTPILEWQKGGTGAGYYELLALAVTAVGGCDLLTMGPCESDAINGTSQANYHTRMAAFVADWLADFPTCKIIWRTLQHIDLGQATQPHQDAINAAILAGAGSVHGIAGGDITGVYLAEVRSVPAYPGDLYHWLTDQQLAVVGGIMSTADLMAMNLRKPRSSSMIGI